MLATLLPRAKSFQILEDNDPTGYKSNQAISAKRDLKINPIEFPKYSPDLNPCDYFLWDEVTRRMENNKPKGKESVDAFKARLRRTALGIPQSVILKGVASMKERAKQIYDAEGNDPARD